tara:strand:- start:564 stop:845 length:282 start_codon:yes stop_codon:yes gene_type:complete
LLLLWSSCSDEDQIIIEEVTTEALLQAVIDEKVGNDTNKLVGVSVSIRIGDEERWKLVGGISQLGQPITGDMKFGHRKHYKNSSSSHYNETSR